MHDMTLPTANQLALLYSQLVEEALRCDIPAAIEIQIKKKSEKEALKRTKLSVGTYHSIAKYVLARVHQSLFMPEQQVHSW